jgi:dynein heavy chain
MDVEPEKDYRSMTEWIVFTDLADRDAQDKESRKYEEIKWREQPRLISLLQYALDDFNGETDKTMSLVMFNYACNHLLRICRILRMARGHCLLIGMGGSGRSSLARLAVHCMGHDFK